MAAPPLAELTHRAQTLTSAGDLVGAQRVLANVLDPAAADPRQASPDLALAAALHARILIALGDVQSARVWAEFAHAAEERLHGPHDERTVAAAATHAAVLQRIGQFGHAARVYRRLVGDLTEIDGPDTPRVLAAEADLATAEHAAGHCGAARGRLSAAWRRHSRLYGDAAPAGIKMLARLGAMERDCGRDAESRDHLAKAQELCARYLPADHPLVRQVAALAAAPASPKHACKAQEAGVTTVETPGVRHLPFPRRPTVPDPSEGFPPEEPADNRATDPNGTVYQQPLYLSDVHQAPGDLTGRHARADTPPPMPGQRAPDYGPDGRPQPVGSAPASTYEPPPNTERRLPVRTEQPPAPRRRQPFILAAVLVAGIAAAVAVVALTLPDADGATGPPPPPATTAAAPSAQATSKAPATSKPPAAKADPGAPQNVRLRDNRDSVVLQWTYPQDAEGPILVSGGRAGQDPKPFQQLPAGSGDYVVYGLNENLNYCFTVAVAYSSNRIATSAPACTKR
ncbi:fibronectin type III domain-containing protein [Actinoplanes sp. NPDC048796]|uniref:fibronectin type III domain-containing protein n=1 Tax=unclassified Actinoplanes TaxID=2626549 RepID=UPI0033CCD0E7